MNSFGKLVKWFKAEPEVMHREIAVPPPVTLDSVSPACEPSPEIATETRAAQDDLAQALLSLGRRSYELRMAVANTAIGNLTGGLQK